MILAKALVLLGPLLFQAEGLAIRSASPDHEASSHLVAKNGQIVPRQTSALGIVAPCSPSPSIPPSGILRRQYSGIGVAAGCPTEPEPSPYSPAVPEYGAAADDSYTPRPDYEPPYMAPADAPYDTLYPPPIYVRSPIGYYEDQPPQGLSTIQPAGSPTQAPPQGLSTIQPAGSTSLGPGSTPYPFQTAPAPAPTPPAPGYGVPGYDTPYTPPSAPEEPPAPVYGEPYTPPSTPDVAPPAESGDSYTPQSPPTEAPPSYGESTGYVKRSAYGYGYSVPETNNSLPLPFGNATLPATTTEVAQPTGYGEPYMVTSTAIAQPTGYGEAYTPLSVPVAQPAGYGESSGYVKRSGYGESVVNNTSLFAPGYPAPTPLPAGSPYEVPQYYQPPGYQAPPIPATFTNSTTPAATPAPAAAAPVSEYGGTSGYDAPYVAPSTPMSTGEGDSGSVEEGGTYY